MQGKFIAMETTIRIRRDELTLEFLNKIKILFKNDEALEFVISPISDFGLSKKESPELYENRLNKAIENLENKRNTISLSESEFESLTKDLFYSK